MSRGGACRTLLEPSRPGDGVTGRASDHKDGAQHLRGCLNLRVHGAWRLSDRLGEDVIASILRDSQAGTTQRGLAERYGISLSSVKRLLRTHP